MRTVEFKVMETDPAEYCIVAQDTVSLAFPFSPAFWLTHIRLSMLRETPSSERKRRTIWLMSDTMTSVDAGNRWLRQVPFPCGRVRATPNSPFRRSVKWSNCH